MLTGFVSFYVPKNLKNVIKPIENTHKVYIIFEFSQMPIEWEWTAMGTVTVGGGQ